VNADVLAPTATRPWAFDRPVPSGGYAWWYLDAISDDGRDGITVIVFVGTVFSPWYAWSRRWGGGDPANHCCVHVSLFGSRTRWAMTDRRRGALARAPDHLAIGPSDMEWDADGLTIRVDEVTAPIPRRLRGTIRLRPEALSHRAFPLDGAGRHVWQPIAARARAEVALASPDSRWGGTAYFDCNAGTVPLEEDFAFWDWCRAPTAAATAVLYNAIRRDGSAHSLALSVARDGTVADMPPPPPALLPRGFWGVPRPTRSDDGQARLLRTLVDAPFYTRSEIGLRVLGQDTTAVHESLSLDRFRLLPVQAMLPLKVARFLR
jgi:carotenoid 1,2-hydratase